MAFHDSNDQVCTLTQIGTSIENTSEYENGVLKFQLMKGMVHFVHFVLLNHVKQKMVLLNHVKQKNGWWPFLA